MPNEETTLQNLIMLALSDAGCTIWRNETSGAWVGKVIYKTGNQVTLTNARMLSFGLAKGSSDIIGLSPTGRFMAIEVKTKSGRTSTDQRNFLQAVSKSGGIAGIVNSIEQALQLIE